MRHAVALLLKTDTVDWIDYVGKNLSRQRGTEQSRSDVVEYIIGRHWMKTQKRISEERHEKNLDKRYGVTLGPRKKA